MKELEAIELTGVTEVEQGVMHRIRTVGVRGLDTEKAKELGVFNRISNLLCVIHCSIMAAYRIFGGVQYLLNELQARKNEISREMNAFEKAYDRFISFWTNYYAKGTSGAEVNFETEQLYHQLMCWMQIPESWQLGEPQRTDNKKDTLIRIESQEDDKVYTFRKAELYNEILESKESWCVLKYDKMTNRQVVVHGELDKASALMVAKRLSANDTQNYYTAAIVNDIVEKRTDVTPYKAFKGNETVGKVTNTFKG